MTAHFAIAVKALSLALLAFMLQTVTHGPLKQVIIAPDGTPVTMDLTPVARAQPPPHAERNSANLIVPHGTEKGADNCPGATVLKPAHR